MIILLGKAKDNFVLLDQLCQEGVKIFGIDEIENINGLKNFAKLLDSILTSPKPSSEWFDETKFKILKRVVPEAWEAFETIKNKTNIILTSYNREIFDLEYTEMLTRFKTEYTTIFKLFMKKYWSDKKIIKALYKVSDSKLDDPAIINVLTELSSINEKRRWIEENENLLKL